MFIYENYSTYFLNTHNLIPLFLYTTPTSLPSSSPSQVQMVTAKADWERL